MLERRKNGQAAEVGRMLTIPEVAERLRVSRDTVRRLIGAGKLPAYKIGSDIGEAAGKFIIPEGAVARWLETRAVTPAA